MYPRKRYAYNKAIPSRCPVHQLYFKAFPFSAWLAMAFIEAVHSAGCICNFVCSFPSFLELDLSTFFTLNGLFSLLYAPSSSSSLFFFFLVTRCLFFAYTPNSYFFSRLAHYDICIETARGCELKINNNSKRKNHYATLSVHPSLV
jgi:hypothetical protein